MSTRRLPRRFSTRASALPTTSSSGCQSLRTRMPPDSRRVISRRLCTRRFRRSASSSIAWASSRRVAAIERRLLLHERARRAGDGGQRRAQVVGDRAEERVPEPLRLGPEPGLLGFVHQRHPLDGEGRLRGEGLEQVELLGRGQDLAGRRLDAEDPHRAARGGEREIERPRAGERRRCRDRPSARAPAPTARLRARWPRRSPAPAHPHGGRAARRDRGGTPRLRLPNTSAMWRVAARSSSSRPRWLTRSRVIA